jgi:serine/threonine protein kinase
VPFLVFEFVEGRLLNDLIREGEMDPAYALEIFQGILEGIDRAHRQGIVHRDLKPANIIINQDGVPKIMDFGIARVLSGQRDWDTQLIGSPRYMSPEYIEKGEVGTPADVFALGLILDEMLTGMAVFQGASQRAVLDSVVRDAVAPPSHFNQAVDERLDRIVLKALEKDPATRFTNAGDFLQAVRDYRGGSHAPAAAMGGESQSHGTIDFLLRRMQRKSDFPVLAQSIRTLNGMVATSDKNASDLAKVIVKDFALTNKILKVVNSAYFGHFSGKIGTISRAVVVLGMQPIRSLAASLIFYEHLHDKTQAEDLKAQTSAALFSAILATHVSAELDPSHREEHFLTAMLQNLGRILVTYYLYDEGQEIARLQKQQGIVEAERSVLGATYEEIGQGIAKQWNFPEDINRSLKALPPEIQPKAPRSLNESRRIVATFSNEASLWLGGDENQGNRLRTELLSRFEQALDLDDKKLNQLVARSSKEFLKLVQNVSTRGKEDVFLQRIQARMEDRPQGTQAGTRPIKETAADADGAKPTVGTRILEGLPADQTGDADALLTEGLQEATNILLNNPRLPDLCNIVLETMYRAMAFQHVILCLRDITGRHMNARIGFGSDVEQCLKHFHFPLAWEPDVFHAALKNDVDVYISDVQDPKVKMDLPAWYGKFATAGSFLLFPLVVRKRPLGLIYCDHPRASSLVVTGKTLNLLKALRNQIILGIRDRM